MCIGIYVYLYNIPTYSYIYLHMTAYMYVGICRYVVKVEVPLYRVFITSVRLNLNATNALGV